MKKNKLIPLFIKGRRGFTLTEILLAVMIVGLISVSLAALTRAAARESGSGRSKIMLRNNLSSFVRILRGDIAQATVVNSFSNAATCSTKAPVVLLQLAQNVDRDGTLIIKTVEEGSASSSHSATYITYCFLCGSDTTNISPYSAKRGGKIYRLTDDGYYPSCSSYQAGELVLDNVKWLSDSNFSVPYVGLDSISRSVTSSLLTVRIITELGTTPIINEAIEETFAMPMGY